MGKGKKTSDAISMSFTIRQSKARDSLERLLKTVRPFSHKPVCSPLSTAGTWKETSLLEAEEEPADELVLLNAWVRK